jgi:hypothetical protein
VNVNFSVDSNDAMYGSDPKFLAEVKGIADTLLTQILAHLKTLSIPEVRTVHVKYVKRK